MYLSSIRRYRQSSIGKWSDQSIRYSFSGAISELGQHKAYQMHGVCLLFGCQLVAWFSNGLIYLTHLRSCIFSVGQFCGMVTNKHCFVCQLKLDHQSDNSSCSWRIAGSSCMATSEQNSQAHDHDNLDYSGSVLCMPLHAERSCFDFVAHWYLCFA